MIMDTYRWVWFIVGVVIICVIVGTLIALTGHGVGVSGG